MRPFSKTLNSEWEKTQDFTDVVWGDAIFEVVQKGAKLIEAEWSKIAAPFDRVLEKSVQTFFGWGEPITPPQVLRKFLFGLPKYWPKGLTPKERQLLKLAVAVSHYNPKYDPDPPQVALPPEEKVLEALRSFAAEFEEKIAFPMWKAYYRIAESLVPQIQEACGRVYTEPCSREDSLGFFLGDFARAWKVESLKVTSVTYRVFGVFDDYVELVYASKQQ